MRALFDLNALIALIDEEHVHNPILRDWWASNREHGWASCPLTENGFVHVVSQPSYSTPLSVADAFVLLDVAIGQGDHEFWADDLSLTDSALVDRRHVLGPKQLTDIYLLVLAVKNGGRLVTFDRAIPIAAARGATSDNLVLL